MQIHANFFFSVKTMSNKKVVVGEELINNKKKAFGFALLGEK